MNQIIEQLIKKIEILEREVETLKTQNFVTPSELTDDGASNPSKPLKSDSSGDLTLNKLNVSSTDSDALSVGDGSSGSIVIGSSGWSVAAGVLELVSGSNFSIPTTSPATAIYSADTYLGDVSGDNIRTRGSNLIVGANTTGQGASFDVHAHSSTNNYDNIRFHYNGTRMGEIGSGDTTWFRINQVTNKNIYTPRMFRADGGILMNTQLMPIVDNSVDVGAASLRFDDVYATNGTIQTSDQNQKSNIQDSDLGLDFINDLRPVSFRWQGGQRTHYGLIAQEVEDTLDGKDFGGLIINEAGYGLRYSEFIPIIIQAIKEINNENRRLTIGWQL